MSEEIVDRNFLEKIDLIIPPTGRLFFESKKQELLLCKPYLMPLKSITLEKLEKMQKDAYEQLKRNRNKSDNAASTTNLSDLKQEESQ